MNLKNTYLIGSGVFLPGDPIDNNEIDSFIRPMNKRCERMKNKILKENGIEKRYYAIDEEGRTRFSHREMAERSSLEALESANVSIEDLDLICTGTVGSDQAVPGFANMLQGKLKAPPLETSSHGGICMSGVVALKHAFHSVQVGETKNALVTATEFPSRMFKKSRFQGADYNVDFDSHFLRWMLSDASGSFVVSDKPKENGLSLKLDFIHTKSFSGDFPMCMQIGSTKGDEDTSYLDYESLADAEKDGAFFLRQDIRLLPHLFDVGIHEYVKCAESGLFNPDEIDHFLCHYSSQKFEGVVADLLDKAKLSIPKEKWFSNLIYKGNTGSASIFVMLDELIKTKDLKAGQKIFCLVPESARISISFLQFTVVEKTSDKKNTSTSIELPASPSEQLKSENDHVAGVLRELANVWHEYRSDVWRSNYITKIQTGDFGINDYLGWMENWVPQVREGSKWMRLAISNIVEPYLELKEIIEEHATDEQDDWKLLFENYQKAGGQIDSPDNLYRNAGGEGLNAFMYERARKTNSVDLLGAIYIIEGTGQKIIPALLPKIKELTGLSPECFSFLSYHGQNDEHHLLRWLGAVEYVLTQSDNPEKTREQMVRTAKVTAQLYAMQMQMI